LLDTPPVLAVTDSVIISSIADSMLLVFRAGKTRRKTMLAAVEELRRARANIIGVVLNRVELSKAGLPYSRHYRYDRYGVYGQEAQDQISDIK